VRTFTGHEGAVYAFALSPDGHRLLSVSADNTIRQWDIQSGEQIERLELQEGDISYRAAAFSPDGTRLLLGLEDRSLVLLDVETGEVIQRMAGHDSPIMKVAISPDGQTAISGSGPEDYIPPPPPGTDLSMRWWDLSTGEQIRRFEGHTHTIWDLAFRPDGRSAVTGSWDGSLVLWDLETGASLQRMIGVGPETAYYVSAVAISPDGQRALANVGSWVNLWDLENGEFIQTLGVFNSVIISLAFSPDGQEALAGDMTGEVRTYNLETGEELLRFFEHSVDILQMTFSSAGQSFISGSRDATLRLWSLKNGAEIRRFEHEVGEEGHVSDVVYSPDGRTAISCANPAGNPGVLNLWNLETGQALRRIELPAWCWRAVYTLDSASALVTFWNDGGGDVIQYDLSTGEELQRLGGESEADGHKAGVDALAISPDGKTALSGADEEERALFLWDLESGQQLMEFQTTHVFSVDISPDGRTALTGIEDIDGIDFMILWNLETGEIIRQFEGHNGLIWDVAYSPDGKTGLSASWDSSLILWNLENGEIIHRLQGHQDIVRAVAFHPDGRTAVSGSRDGTLILWDLETGEAIRRYRGHTDTLNSVAFSRDGQRVLSGGVDGLMIEWRIDDTLEELVSWTEANRYLRELNCSEREQFNIEPLCE
jgi:WD40 repeat protein